MGGLCHLFLCICPGLAKILVVPLLPKIPGVDLPAGRSPSLLVCTGIQIRFGWAGGSEREKRGMRGRRGNERVRR